MKKRDWEKDFQLAKGCLNDLKKLCPQRIRHGDYSSTAKIPFKVASIKEVFLFRVIEISEIAIELIEKNKYLPAAILIRSIMETTAMLYYVYDKMKSVVDDNDVGDIDKYLMRVLLGCKEKENLAKPINVLTAIQKVDKWMNPVKPDTARGNLKGPFMGFYDGLCDYTHPNWYGGLGAYGEIDKEDFSIKLSDCATPNIPVSEVVCPLSGTLFVFKHAYLNINNLMKIFIEICEQ